MGALKARLWALIFKVWRPSPASVRVPADLAGRAFDLVVLSIDVANGEEVERAALAGVALLATDPIYVLYSRWDHGTCGHPAFVLWIGAMLALVRFQQERRVGLAGRRLSGFGVGVVGEGGL